MGAGLFFYAGETGGAVIKILMLRVLFRARAQNVLKTFYKTGEKNALQKGRFLGISRTTWNGLSIFAIVITLI